LYVEIVELAHEYLVREDNNLHISVAIPMASAALGTTVEIETLDGKKSVEINEGTQSGATVLLRGLGVTKLRGSGRGDLIVHIEVTIPSKLNKEQIDLLRKFAQSRNDEPGAVSIHKSQDEGFFSKVRNAFR
jgi:molecular chaperone DnaJ